MRFKTYILFSLLTAAPLLTIGQRKKVDYTGQAIGLMQHQVLSATDTLQNDHMNAGYFLLDFGFRVRPNSITEIQADLRLKTPYGGFYGAGSTIEFRQLYARGIIANHVKYRVGDFRHQMTPFTLHNTTDVTSFGEANIFACQREINQYNLFIDSAKWWMQGAWAGTALEFDKGIQRIDFEGFVARNRQSDMWTQPDAIQYGGDVIVQQSKALKIAGHYVAWSDLPSTAMIDKAYSNQVTSGAVTANKQWGDFAFKFNGESGLSSMSFGGEANTPETVKDYFAQSDVKVAHIPTGIAMTIGYRNVGPEFISAGSQSLHLDYSSAPALFENGLNTDIARTLGMYDLMTQRSLYTPAISPQWQVSPTAWNNALVYGAATPNRKGISGEISYQAKQWLDLQFIGHQLTEISAFGTSELRQFQIGSLLGKLNVHELMNWNNALTFSFGVRHENTSRGGSEIETVDLTNSLINLGIDWECYPSIFLMSGYKYGQTYGNEILGQFNAYNEIEQYESNAANLRESIWAVGLRYQATDKTHLNFIYQAIAMDDESNPNAQTAFSNFSLLLRSTF